MSELTRDAFLGGRLQIFQPATGYRAGVDAVLLAAAVPARPGESVLELGCGVGVAALCLGWRVRRLDLHGVELQPDYAALARRNAAENAIPFEVWCADLRRLPEALRARSFDHVFANPPFHRQGGGTPARDPGREAAFREAAPLQDWMRAAARRLRPGGWLTMIQRVERLPELLGAASGLGSATVWPIAGRAGRDAERVLFRARKGGRGPFTLKSPLVMHEGRHHLRDGEDFSARIRGILRNGEALDTT